MAPEVTAADVPRASGMPMLGLGTWQNDDHDQCVESVRTALEAGYRHVDTAQAYGNERAVGEGIATADVAREEVFLASKVWYTELDYENVVHSTRESLQKLQVDSVDLMYVHWPADTYDVAETMDAFDKLYHDGLIEHVGVSNFEPDQLAAAADHADAPIFANQVELHPLLPQREVREACAAHDVEVVAYSPLARGDVFDVPAIQTVAEKHGVSEAQVSLAWLREKGVTAIPKATGRDHLLDNLASVDLSLDDEDVARIDDVSRTDRKVDPDFAPW